MNFKEVNHYLQNLFSEIDFFAVANEPNGLHSYTALAEKCTGNGSIISVSYPGYKAKQDGKTKDYRVGIRSGDVITSLSHVNIVIDIYNKIHTHGICAESLFNALMDFIKDGDISVISKIDYVPSTPPTEEIISRALAGHPNNEKRKGYNRIGNSVDWTIEELFVSIKWIAVQEDINYPGGLGRKMPFLRYLEAIDVAVSDAHTLEEVIGRTLEHRIPPTWRGIVPEIFEDIGK